VPAGGVDDEDDGVVRAGADLPGECFQGRLEGGGVDGVEQEPDDLAAAQVDEAVEVEPLVAVA
jgi:hypothetical protein